MKHKLLLFIFAFAVISSFSSYSQPTGCGPVTDLMISNITSDSAIVFWNDSGASSYRVIIKSPGSPVKRFTLTGTYVQLTQLTPSTFYTITILNRCHGVPDAYSVSSSFTTDPAKFAVQSALQTSNIYPNPGSGLFMIENANHLQNVSVLDASGKVLMNIKTDEKETISFDLSSFAPGVYLIRMQNANQIIYTEKLILEH